MADYSGAYEGSASKVPYREYERAIAAAKDSGYQIGYTKGFDDGFVEGYKEGRARAESIPAITPPRCQNCKAYVWQDQAHSCRG